MEGGPGLTDRLDRSEFDVLDDVRDRSRGRKVASCASATSSTRLRSRSRSGCGRTDLYSTGSAASGARMQLRSPSGTRSCTEPSATHGTPR